MLTSSAVLADDDYINLADIIKIDPGFESLMQRQTAIQATADKADEEIQQQLGNLTNFLSLGSTLLSRRE